jgi:anti-sigma factor RsiW
MKCHDCTPLFDSYLDGELDLTASVALEGHLSDCASCRSILENRQHLTTLIQQEIPRFSAPSRLKAQIRTAIRAEERASSPSFHWNHWFTPLWTAAACGLLVVSLLVCFWPPSSHSLMDEVLADHIRSLQVDHLLDVASTDQHTVKPWFAGKLTYSPPVVDLTSDGYPLIGGRLDVLQNQEVSAIVYQHRKHTINLFIYPVQQSPQRESFHQQDGYHVFVWSSSGMNYLAVSDLNQKELQEFIDLIRAHID